MSPLAARTARTARTAFRAVQQRRPFSVIHTMRAFARQFETHPFQRVPVTSGSQAGNWGKMLKERAVNMTIYVPFMAAVLGWPLAAQAVCNSEVWRST